MDRPPVVHIPPSPQPIPPELWRSAGGRPLRFRRKAGDFVLLDGKRYRIASYDPTDDGGSIARLQPWPWWRQLLHVLGAAARRGWSGLRRSS